MHIRGPIVISPAKQVANLKPSFIREILAAATQPDVISLAGGLPAEECYPMGFIAESLDSLAALPNLFQYGSTKGYAPLVEFVESSFCLDRSHTALVCNGSQQALDLVARAFIDPGDSVVMETPGYLGAIQVFSLAQANILPVEQQPDGPDTFALEAVFKSNSVKFFYAVPDFHNPTGVAWSLEKRKLVANLCEQFDVILIEDAPYRDIRFSGEALPMASTFCPDHAIVLRSFSKSICPGMRLGVAMATGNLINIMIKVKQAADLHTSTPMQKVLVDVLSHDGFNNHLTTVCAEYGRRYRALRKAISDEFGDAVSYREVEGGMFIWLQIPQGNSAEIASRAIQRKLAVVPGGVFYPHDSDSNRYLRLNFSHTETSQFPEAIARLRASL